MKTTNKPAKAPEMTQEMTQEECLDALDAARASLTTCEQSATLVSDWNTLKALKAARVTVADLQTQWDAMQPALEPTPPAPRAKMAAKPEPEPVSPEILRMIQCFEKEVYGFALEDELIQSANVRQVARECVDLSVAFSPVIPFPKALPTDVESTNGGKMYRVKMPLLPDGYINATPDDLKIMRARYILTRNAKYQDLQDGKRPAYEDIALFQALFPSGVFVLPRPTPKDADVTAITSEAEAPPLLPVPVKEPIDPTSTTPDEAMARLKFGWLLRAMGQDEYIKTDSKMDEVKLKRVCNEIVRGVASDRSTPTAYGWEAATHILAERNGYTWREATKKWERQTT